MQFDVSVNMASSGKSSRLWLDALLQKGLQRGVPVLTHLKRKRTAMKQIVLACVLVACASSAHAESYVTDVTSCTTGDIMTQYTKDVHITRLRSQDDELALLKGQCVYGMTAFTVILKTAVFANKGVQYSIVKVETAQGVRYVMYYEPAPVEA